jgi:hypothetical protein
MQKSTARKMPPVSIDSEELRQIASVQYISDLLSYAGPV